MKAILGGKNGNLKCACSNPRFAGTKLCPQCFYGDDFDPIAFAQAKARSEEIQKGNDDPYKKWGIAANALNYARWLVEQGYVGWATAYKRAAKKYGCSEFSIRSIAAKRAAETRTFK